jgi:hypothetical protein
MTMPHVAVTGLIATLISGLMQHIVPDGRGSLPCPTLRVTS